MSVWTHQAVLCGPLKTVLHAGLRSCILELNWEALKSSKQGGHGCCGAFWGLRRMLSWELHEGCRSDPRKDPGTESQVGQR